MADCMTYSNRSTSSSPEDSVLLYQKRRNPQKYISFHNYIAVLGTCCLVHNQLRNQTKAKFSFSQMEFYGLYWSLVPNRLRDRDWTTTDLLLLHRRATATKHGLGILKTLPNKTMGCRNKMTV